MSEPLVPRKLTRILPDSFAFLSRNFAGLGLLFMVPAFILLVSGVLLRTGFSFLATEHEPFTLHIRQAPGQTLLINGKVPANILQADGTRLVAGLPREGSFTLETAATLRLPDPKPMGYLLAHGSVRRIPAETVRRLAGGAATNTLLFFLKTPGWRLYVDGTPAFLQPTANPRVGMLAIKEIEKTEVRIVHNLLVETGRQSRGWVDGLEFTWGSPALSLPGWADVAFQIGSLLGMLFLTGLLVSHVHVVLTGTDKPSPGMVLRDFRAGGMRTGATLLFLTLLQIPLLGLVQGVLFMGDGGSMIIFLVPALILLAARMAPAVFIARMEQCNPWQALRGSFQLTQGASLRFFLSLSVVLFVMILYLNLGGIDRKSVV